MATQQVAVVASLCDTSSLVCHVVNHADCNVFVQEGLAVIRTYFSNTLGGNEAHATCMLNALVSILR